MEKVLIAREKLDAKASLMRQAITITDVRIQSVSAAIAYLLLILHQMGLGAVWMVNPVSQAKEEIENILQVPAETDIIALIPVGYPAETPVKTRKPVNEVCQVIK
jgi:nitroreductase